MLSSHWDRSLWLTRDIPKSCVQLGPERLTGVVYRWEMVKEHAFPGGPMASLSPGCAGLWLRAALTQELRGHGSGYWENNVREAKSNSLVEVRLHSSMPQVQSIVRLRCFPSHMQICMCVQNTHTNTYSLQATHISIDRRAQCSHQRKQPWWPHASYLSG